MKKDDGGPAFPESHPEHPHPSSGMSLRAYFAGTIEPNWNAVMELLQSRGVSKPTLEQKLAARVELRLREADALLAALNAPTETCGMCSVGGACTKHPASKPQDDDLLARAKDLNATFCVEAGGDRVSVSRKAYDKLRAAIQSREAAK